MRVVLRLARRAARCARASSWPPAEGAGPHRGGARAAGRAPPGAGGVPGRRRGAVRLLHAGARSSPRRPPPADPDPAEAEIRQALAGNPAAARATRRSSTRCDSAGRRAIHRPRGLRDRDRRRRRHGHADGQSWSRTAGSRPSARARRRGDGRPPGRRARLPRHARGWSTATTTSTSGRPAGSPQEATLFEWLKALYPVWARLDADGRARRGPRRPSRRCCARAAPRRRTTTTSSRAAAATCSARDRGGARRSGVRFHPCRGSMDLGRSRGGLPPDEVVEDRDAILAATEAAIDALPRPGARRMLRIAVAPCSPFSVTGRADARDGRARPPARRAPAHPPRRDARRGGVLPRALRRAPGGVPGGPRLARPGRVARPLRAPDAREVRRFGATGTGVAHCPSSNARLGAGIAPVPALLAPAWPVGLGVDGAASNEAGRAAPEVRQALLVARAAHGPPA